ncbi:universal stress protein [Arthrobacter cupressi]|uniref:Nucleotide-binding universal stress protein, UspA family n=1 Tax=Arthrobacter cupressi TaxID=1045773 RepID=A0A1G8PIY4_9MICC|nr:universal stress protein [Arthrobacter cupressi]NYD76855.1 nucleotide-binding universal stress UspA family protein [Arthrobacter cupressi]SDI92296.1 Nucleotide-binding universal stress protein, UspA family [Arthrobacter cupressi]
MTASPPNSPDPGLAGPVLAGVVPGQPGEVLQRAAGLALGTGAPLVVAYVDPTLDRSRQPIDPDGVDDDAEDIAAALRDQAAARLAGSGVAWSFVVLAGDPVRELARHAAAVDASTIVVGSTEHGPGRHFAALTGGSLAERLARHAGAPVLVVPPAAVTHGRSGTA